ncbi:hypothetical protein [Pseudonocardia sp.]|uniref:hypothetical protein n=1 Tax=Pseudonocardia sp. TaxID=60912 RepID=UPI003D109312
MTTDEPAAGRDTAKGRADIERYEQAKRDRELDDDHIQRIQTLYERWLGWTHD